MKIDLSKLDKSLVARSWVRLNSDPDTKKIVKYNLPRPNYQETLSVDGDTWPYSINPEDLLTDLNYQAPNIVYDIIIEIAQLTDDPWLLELLAAGPVESLIKYSHDADQYRAMYEKLAASDPKHAEILSMVWL